MAMMRVAQVSRAKGPFEIVERPIPSRVPDGSVSRCTLAASVTVIRSRRRGPCPESNTRESPVTKWRAWLTRWAPVSPGGSRDREWAWVGMAAIAGIATSAAAASSSPACAARYRPHI